MKVRQDADLYGKGEAAFTMEASACRRPVRIALRLPEWSVCAPDLTLNGEEVSAEIRDGYAVVERRWEEGDRLVLKLVPGVWHRDLPDAPFTVGFGYGPLVLCALMGTEDMRCNYTGANMDVELTTVDIGVPKEIRVNGDPEAWLASLPEHLVREGSSLTFRLKDVAGPDLVFVPYYSQYRERYGIYWDLIPAENV